MAVAWSISSGEKLTITKEELLDMAFKVVPHFSSYEGYMKNVVFQALNFKDEDAVYDFIDVVNVFHKF